MIVNRSTAEEACKTLEIAAALGTFDAEYVNTMFKLRAMQVHPDKGGSMEAFVAIDRAKHILLKWLERAPDAVPPALQADCPRCDGLGYISQSRGFAAPLRRQCPRCHGSGDANYERDKTHE